ncbi:MAG: RNA-binding S4 domain-containing protein [Clostridiaceae bacterium]|nr:RNA-binding S4 domain-containing protein [Clostridiaceae bacterium]
MRIDKFLKVSRIIKRRTIANDVCAAGRVSINGKAAKPSTEVSVNDRIDIAFGNGVTSVRVVSVAETVRKNEAAEMYEILPQPKHEVDSDYSTVTHV